MKSDIWKVISEIGIELHPDRVNALAEKIASLSSFAEFENNSMGFGNAVNKTIVDALKKAWRGKYKISPQEVSAALRVASITANTMGQGESIEMVWTGPFTGLVASRHTEQVLQEVIGSARSSLFIVSFVAYDIEPIIKALQAAVGRDVKINILLEPSKSHGGKIDIDSIDSFKKAIPSANIYIWYDKSKYFNSSNSDEPHGAVHAKCAVADDYIAFITSANLTRYAMDYNMELGVLVRGGGLPKKLNSHLEALITTRIIKKY